MLFISQIIWLLGLIKDLGCTERIPNGIPLRLVVAFFHIHLFILMV